MKRLWIATAILFLILFGTLYNSFYLSQLIDGYELRLNAAHELAKQGAWHNAGQLTRQVLQDWEKRSFYLHVLLQHANIDNINLSFQEVLEYLSIQEADQYTAANARLITQLGLLAEAELLTLRNIL